jgi:hypothetical protein
VRANTQDQLIWGKIEMKSYGIPFIALAAALAITPAAMADTYSYVYSDGTDTATGTLDVTSLGGGTYGILGGTITISGPNGIDGSGVVLPDPSGPGSVWTEANPPNSGGADYIADNLFFPGQNPQLDDDGFNFELTSYAGPAGGIWGNLWGNGPGNYTLLEGAYNIDSSGSFDATPAAVPEPSSLFLLGTGLLGLAFVAFRKSRFARRSGFSLGAL